MRRLAGAITASLLVVTLLPTLGEAAQRTSKACRGRPTSIHAFTVKAEWNKKVYSTSEKARVTVTVTRPAPEDPLGLGQPIDPPLSVPVEGAEVWSTVDTGVYPYPADYGETDANGEVDLKIPLHLIDEPGPYDVGHLAEVWTNEGGCPDIQEYGYLKEEPGFTVAP